MTMNILATGLSGVLISVMFHALTTSGLLQFLSSERLAHFDSRGMIAKTIYTGLFSGILATKHAVDIFVWALIYWYFVPDSLFKFEDAIYFSSVTYTSLGYGDIVLSGPARFLCSFEAISGMLLFGWSTALILAVVNRLWNLRLPA